VACGDLVAWNSRIISYSGASPNLAEEGAAHLTAEILSIDLTPHHQQKSAKSQTDLALCLLQKIAN
jgi:hypothetical protein